MLVTKGGYGLVPANSAYTEIKYSSGGTCNNLLGRDLNWVEAQATTYTSSGVMCGNADVYN
ncbi:MAG: hypothetical protein JWL72_1269, partial [Ilumatobacteraceae bacterium]|nr:hypothetical protein [Ilumatobacteraceae bacterium]